MIIYVSDRVENIVGKGEITGNQHFLLFSQCSEKASFPGVIVWEWVKNRYFSVFGKVKIFLK